MYSSVHTQKNQARDDTTEGLPTARTSSKLASLEGALAGKKEWQDPERKMQAVKSEPVDP